MAATRALAVQRDSQSAEERTSPSLTRAGLSRKARIPSQSPAASRAARQARRRVRGGRSRSGSATRSGRSRRGRPAAVRKLARRPSSECSTSLRAKASSRSAASREHTSRMRGDSWAPAITRRIDASNSLLHQSATDFAPSRAAASSLKIWSAWRSRASGSGSVRARAPTTSSTVSAPRTALPWRARLFMWSMAMRRQRKTSSAHASPFSGCSLRKARRASQRGTKPLSRRTARARVP